MAQETRLFKEISVFLDEHFERLSSLEIRIIIDLHSQENYLDHKAVSKKKYF